MEKELAIQLFQLYLKEYDLHHLDTGCAAIDDCLCQFGYEIDWYPQENTWILSKVDTEKKEIFRS